VLLGLVAVLAPIDLARATCPEEPFATETLLSLADGADGIGGSGRGPTGGADGIGGSGHAPPGSGDEDGIGGSGRGPTIDPEDGIGGSGLVGTITAFGSVCLNGVEVELAGSVRVTLDDREADLAALAVGQLVTIGLAEGGVGGSRGAATVSVEYAVVGPIASLADGDDATARVLGERVLLSGLPDADRAVIAVGERVAVSGLRRADGAIVASRVDRAPPDALDGVRSAPGEGVAERDWRILDLEGYVTAVDALGLEVHGLRFVLPDPAATASVRRGDRVRIRGVASAERGVLRAVGLVRVPERVLLRSIDRAASNASAGAPAAGASPGDAAQTKGRPGSPPGQAVSDTARANAPGQAVSEAARANAPGQAVSEAARANAPGQAVSEAARANAPGQAVSDTARANAPGQAVRDVAPGAAVPRPSIDRPTRPARPELPDRPAARPERPERPPPPRDFLPPDNPGRGRGNGRP